MYELLTLVDEERPFVIVEHPSRVVFTLKKRDKQLAEQIVQNLNDPYFEAIDEVEENEADDVAAAA